jgi:hypothetical protein
VTGIAVLPPLGRYQSDRASPGVGIVLSEALVGADVLNGLVTFVGVDLAPGIEADAIARHLRAAFPDWVEAGDFTIAYPDAVRPPEIVDADTMRLVPLVVGALLAIAAVVALVSAVVVSVRARRRELGTLRALGFTGAQLRTSVRVQALATMALALVVGVPLGLVAGRVSWRAFAARLGVVPDPATPWAWIALTVAGGAVVAVAAATLPGRDAARTSAAAILRSE